MAERLRVDADCLRSVADESTAIARILAETSFDADAFPDQPSSGGLAAFYCAISKVRSRQAIRVKSQAIDMRAAAVAYDNADTQSAGHLAQTV